MTTYRKKTEYEIEITQEMINNNKSDIYSDTNFNPGVIGYCLGSNKGKIGVSYVSGLTTFASAGDYIIRHSDGSASVVKGTIFELLHENFEMAHEEGQYASRAKLYIKNLKTLLLSRNGEDDE